MTSLKTYTLLGADGTPYQSAVKGQLGGNRRSRIYGRLDCPAALRAIARGGYTRHRVFFADQPAAIAAGYRPCATCCPDRYQQWKSSRLGPDVTCHRRQVPLPAASGPPEPDPRSAGPKAIARSRRDRRSPDEPAPKPDPV